MLVCVGDNAGRPRDPHQLRPKYLGRKDASRPDNSAPIRPCGYIRHVGMIESSQSHSGTSMDADVYMADF